VAASTNTLAWFVGWLSELATLLLLVVRTLLSMCSWQQQRFVLVQQKSSGITTNP